MIPGMFNSPEKWHNSSYCPDQRFRRQKNPGHVPIYFPYPSGGVLAVRSPIDKHLPFPGLTNNYWDDRKAIAPTSVRIYRPDASHASRSIKSKRGFGIASVSKFRVVTVQIARLCQATPHRAKYRRCSGESVDPTQDRESTRCLVSDLLRLSQSILPFILRIPTVR